MSQRRRPTCSFRPKTDELEKLSGASTFALGGLAVGTLAADQPAAVNPALEPGVPGKDAGRAVAQVTPRRLLTPAVGLTELKTVAPPRTAADGRGHAETLPGRAGLSPARAPRPGRGRPDPAAESGARRAAGSATVHAAGTAVDPGVQRGRRRLGFPGFGRGGRRAGRRRGRNPSLRRR